MFNCGMFPWVEVDAAALLANLAALRARAKTGTEIAAVLKANAFGHGLEVVAPVLAEEAGYLAAAEPADAIRLASFAPGRVICLGPAYGTALQECIERDVQVTVSTIEGAEALPPAARVHALVDTGLRRLGVAPDRLHRLVEAIAARGATLVGVFCHVAAADRGKWTDVELEVELLRRVAPAGVPTHVGGSSVLIQRPDLCGAIARPGISVFGCHPTGVDSELVSLRPTLSVFAPVLELRSVPRGEPIGYEGRRLDRDTEIATLAIGVAHGLDARRWQGGAARIDGHNCPFVVRPSLDYTMVDVSEVRAKPGQGALVVGGEAGAPTSVKSIAARVGASADDVLVGISPELPRRLIGLPQTAGTSS
ncbi:MAG: alanine racemase [Actinobacteria bacterium]|nr:alanine racemase [Actinomycetota bacterium]